MMKFIWPKIILCCFLFLMVPFLKAEARSPVADSSCMVLIDPAHGGDDTGVKVSKKGVEKDITLAIALMLKKQLEENDKKITVCLTRTEDISVSINERVRMVEQLKPRVLISLHVNGGFGTDASGYEIIFSGQRHKETGKSKREQASIVSDMEKTQDVNLSIRLAQLLQKSLDDVFPRKGRGIREISVPLLSAVPVPAVCVELAFLTNEADRDRILAAKTQKSVVNALTKGIREYLK